jgi:hypothetical protein
MSVLTGYLPELYMGLSSLLVHKLRSLLTMLGMIFGVGAVVAMLSITAGAQKEMMSYIDLLGVNNIIIEAKEAVDRNELQARRAISPGLTFRDFRAITENVQGLEAATPRKRFKPTRVLPKTGQEMPLLIGVLPNYEQINSLKMVSGRFFNEEENLRSAPVCVLGESAKVNLLGYEDAVGKYVKINDVWLQVIGVLSQQAVAESEVEGLEVVNRNNLVIAPLNTVMRRFEDSNSYLKDEIDGIYIKVTPGYGFHRDRQRGAGHPGRHAQGRGRFHGRGARPPAGTAPPHAVHLQRGDDLHRGHLPAGGRHRHHEHHAGHRAGAHARDRHPPRHRRQAERHHPAVPHRGGPDLDRGGLIGIAFGFGLLPGDRGRSGLVHGGHLHLDRGGFRRVGGDRPAVRHLSGRAGRQTGPHRGDPL